MRHATVILVAALLVATAGCGLEAPFSNEENARANRWLVGSYIDAGIAQAIVRQRSLYPYHFGDNSGMLNELGRRDLEILTVHFLRSPGKLNIRQGQESDELYKERVAGVVGLLIRSGVDAKRVAIEDGLPGGDGMSSERVVVVFASEQELKASGYSGYVITSEEVIGAGGGE